MKIGIRVKILIWLILSVLVVVAVSVLFTFKFNYQQNQKQVLSYTRLKVKEAAKSIESDIQLDLNIVETLAASFSAESLSDITSLKDLASKMYMQVFEKNNQLYSLWDSWELTVVDPEWEKPYGRFVNIFWREGEKINYSNELRSLDGDPELYSLVKEEKRSLVWDPYYDQFTSGKSGQSLMTTLSAPILINGTYSGIVAVDITLDRFQDLIRDINPFAGTEAFLIAANGTIAGHKEDRNLNKLFVNLLPEINEQYLLDKKMLSGNPFDVEYIANSKKYFMAFEPVYFNATSSPWYFAMTIPVESFTSELWVNLIKSVLITGLAIGMLIGLLFLITAKFVEPVKRIRDIVKRLSDGELTDNMVVQTKRKDEIGEIIRNLNIFITRLAEKKEFAAQIGEGNLNASLSHCSEKDDLAVSLIQMRDNLLKAKNESDLIRQKEAQRSWVNEGLSLIGDAIRNEQDMDKIGINFITRLVKYVGANQAGLFLKRGDTEDSCFESVAMYAYDRQKFTDKRIMPGVGLIGACILEKETIHMTDIPPDYIEITSGLGGATPGNLLLVPMLDEKNVIGIIEIASFKPFDSYRIELVERLAKSLAGIISNADANANTQKLLLETRIQKEELASQEEELRQNMEELQATQEEMTRRQVELQENQKLLDNIIDMVPFPIFVKDHETRYILANQEQARLFGLAKEQLLNKSDKDFICDQVQLLGIERSDHKVLTNNHRDVLPEQELTFPDGSVKVLQSIKVPIHNNLTGKTNILGVSIDRSERHVAQKNLEEVTSELNRVKKELLKYQQFKN